jgi:hypothetical protein
MNVRLRYHGLGLLAFVAMTMLTITASSQPPEGKNKKEGMGDKKGPRFELGMVLPPFVRESLDLTPAQQAEIAKLEKDVKAKLRKILTPEQLKAAESARPKGPPGGINGGEDKKGPPGGKDGKDRPPFEKNDKQ